MGDVALRHPQIFTPKTKTPAVKGGRSVGQSWLLRPRTPAPRHRVRGVVSDRLAQQGLECGLVDPVAFAEVDCAPLATVQARVEELAGVGELGAVEERELYLVLVCVGERIHALVRPDGRAHPFPFLDYFGVDFVDE